LSDIGATGIRKILYDKKLRERMILFGTCSPGLEQYFKEWRDELIRCAILGTKTRAEIAAEIREKRIKALWDNILLNMKPCRRCGAKADVISNIDCGIDGGPGPITIRGIKIQCSNNCGMKTDVFNNYPGDVQQLALLRRVKNIWNSYK